MINRIIIKNAATFDSSEHIIEGLNKINFFYGTNGSGKTTISRIINEPARFPDCQIDWDLGVILECVVYNSDFIEANYVEKLPGIFTLGLREKTIDNQIEEIKKRIESLEIEKKSLLYKLNGENGDGGKQKELANLEEKYLSLFWEAKQDLSRMNSPLLKGLKGVLNNRQDFKDRIINEYVCNTSKLHVREDLEKKAQQIFETELVMISPIADISFDELLEHENSSILAKKVIGKADVDIATLIQKLGNSDWIQQGAKYLESSNGLCPYCQQILPQDFEEKISEYFDETYKYAIHEIERLISSYKIESEKLLYILETLKNSGNKFLDIKKLENETYNVKQKITINQGLLKEKQNNPSMQVSLISLSDSKDRILVLISAANDEIYSHNTMVENIADERSIISLEIWKLVIEEQKTNIADYLRIKRVLEDEIELIKKEIVENNTNFDEAVRINQELERNLSSVQPTANGINALLKSFGFSGFSLSVCDDKRTYRLLRENGDVAHKTLSEGEKHFVSFLYFYYLLSGSQTENVRVNDKIVVIDDPVSSLDNDVLFIITSLLRDLFEGIYIGRSSIKQLIVLSHNVFFYKEMTYFDTNWRKTTKYWTYWMITKNNCLSNVQRFQNNPVTSTYEMLWAEVRNGKESPEKASQVTLPNTMRRILDYYYRFLGGVSFHNLPSQFPDGERQICRALISWTNSGSHAFIDDYACGILSIDGIIKYLHVFEKVFLETGHVSHYKMMMKIEDLEEESNG